MKNNIKSVGTPTPVNTEKEKESRMTKIIRSRLKSKGLTDAQIDERFKKANERLILLLPYPAVGVKKATEMLKKDKVDIVADGTNESKPGNYVYIKTTKDKAEGLSKALRDIGRSSIHKIVEGEEKVVKEKKPTNNTAEKKLAAKKKRKAENLKKLKSRKKNVRKPKKKYSKVNTPYSELKRSKRAKRIAKAIARRERIKAAQKLKMASNDIKRKEIKNTKPVEQELQLKAA